MVELENQFACFHFGIEMNIASVCAAKSSYARGLWPLSRVETKVSVVNCEPLKAA